jgi:nucleoid DNA-binding protein
MSSSLAAAKRAARARKARRQDHPFLEDLRKARRKSPRTKCVTPAELARVVCRRSGAPKHIVWPIVEAFINAAVEALDSGNDLKLKGLGRFYWKKYPGIDGFESRLTGKTYNLPDRVRLKWAVPVRFRRARPDMEKYGVELDDDKVKEASKDDKKTESYLEDGAHCPICRAALDTGGACPTHGTEPLEKRRD